MIDHQRIVQNAFGQKGEGKMRNGLVFNLLSRTVLGVFIRTVQESMLDVGENTGYSLTRCGWGIEEVMIYLLPPVIASIVGTSLKRFLQTQIQIYSSIYLSDNVKKEILYFQVFPYRRKR